MCQDTNQYIYFIQYIDNLSFQILNFFLINHTNDK